MTRRDSDLIALYLELDSAVKDMPESDAQQYIVRMGAVWLNLSPEGRAFLLSVPEAGPGAN